MIDDQPLTLSVDGQAVNLGMQSTTPLVRSVLISLFTWRRANADDVLPANDRMGWWGDSFPVEANDRIGSRLWLLSRAKLTQETVNQAREYAQEALQWLIEDGVASRIEVIAERQGLHQLALGVTVYQSGGRAPINLRFTDVWSFLNV
jgi:phage gp46-like protein